jgi:hypothetical protein
MATVTSSGAFPDRVIGPSLLATRSLGLLPQARPVRARRRFRTPRTDGAVRE